MLTPFVKGIPDGLARIDGFGAMPAADIYAPIVLGHEVEVIS